MRINRNNYEIFFIDYFDGNISAEAVAELFLFLEKNPDLKTEFENFSPMKLQSPEISFPGRDSLRKGEINPANIGNYLVASLEGDLNSIENELLAKFINENPQYNQDVILYGKTISIPDTSIIYPDKKLLRQPVPLYIMYKKEFRIAVAAILLISLFAGTVIVFNRTMVKHDERIAEQKPIPVSPAEIKEASSAPGNTTTQSSPQTPGNTTTQSSPQNTNVVISEKAISLTQKKNHQQIQKTNQQPVSQFQESAVSDQVQLAGIINSEIPQQDLTDMQAVVKSMPDKEIKTPVKEEYLSIWEALRESSEKGIRKAIGKEDEALAYVDDAQDSKIRLVDVVGKGMEKISNDKIQMEAAYDNDKQSNTFSFSVGKFKIEKK